MTGGGNVVTGGDGRGLPLFPVTLHHQFLAPPHRAQGVSHLQACLALVFCEKCMSRLNPNPEILYLNLKS